MHVKLLSKVICFSLIFSLAVISTDAAVKNKSGKDWTQFRGEKRDGTTIEKGFKDKWGSKGLKLVWKKKTGPGFSAISTSGSRFYTMYGEKINEKEGYEYLAAYNRNTGKKIWSVKAGKYFTDEFGDGPRSTPAVDSKAVYCLSSYGNLIAVSKKTGKIIWEKDFKKEYKAKTERWGFSASPLVDEKNLYIETGAGKGKAFSAFDKKSGKLLWQKGDGRPTYTSPVLINACGVEQLIFINRKGLVSLDKSGNINWSLKTKLAGPTAMPLFIAPDKIFLSEVSRAGCALIQINKDGKGAKQLWTNRFLKNHWSSSVYHNGYIYGFDNASLRCISAEDGKKRWTKRGFGKGSLILVEGRLLILSDKGKLILAGAQPDKFHEMSSFQALNGKSWTEPVLSRGRLYLRNLQEMACYILK